MKKEFGIILILFVFFFFSSAAAGEFGPAEPMSKAGKFSLGVGYFYDQRKWEQDDEISFTVATPVGTITGSLTQDEGKSKSKSNQIYVQGGFGFIKNWEVYGRFGVADLKLSDMEPQFKDDFRPYGTLGVKGVLFPSIDPGGYISVGPFLEASLASNYEDKVSAAVATPVGTITTSLTQKVKNIWDVNFGATVQVKSQGICFYFGPVVYWQRARLEVEGDINTPLGSLTVSAKTNFKETTNFGGFMGVKFNVYDNINIEVEGQYKGQLSAGGSIIYSF